MRTLKLKSNAKGATTIEYALIAMLIGIAIFAGAQGVGNHLNTTYNNVSNSLS